MSRLYRLAERWARLPRGSLIAQELVAEVIEDVLTGDVPCDVKPQHGAEVQFRQLDGRITRVVQKRATRLHEGKGGMLGRPGRSEPRALELDDAPTEELAVELRTRLEDAETRLDLPALVARIRELASGDEKVEELLALYDRNVVVRRAVLRRTQTGMTRWSYRKARERLMAFALMAVREAAPRDGGEMSSADMESEELAIRHVLGRVSLPRPSRSVA